MVKRMTEYTINDIAETARDRFNESIGGIYSTTTLISTTNPRFDRYIGWTNELRLLDLGCRFGEWFRTSYTVSATIVENILTVNTRNSVYVFKVVSPDKQFTLSKVEQDELEALICAY